MQNNLQQNSLDFDLGNIPSLEDFYNPKSKSNSLFGEDGFGFNAGTFGAIGTGLEGLSSLASLYFGNKQINLAEDQLASNRAFGNRNIANQAKTVNNSLEARYRAALAAQGVDPANGGTGTGGTNRESLQSYLDRSRVDGSPIGEGG